MSGEKGGSRDNETEEGNMEKGRWREGREGGEGGGGRKREGGGGRDLFAGERNENSFLKSSQNCVVQLLGSVGGSHDQDPLPSFCRHL